MYELWARRRYEVKNDFIKHIEHESMFHTEVDRLDKEKYSEAIIFNSNHNEPAIYYEEFKQYKPMVRKKVR